MPGAAVIGAALNTAASRGYGLWIDGLDVSKEPATPSRYGVLADSIELTLAGPGGVSSLTFTIDDPQRLITISDGQNVRFERIGTQVMPVFQGFVQSWSVVPDFGQQGRSITVTCIGVETLLDWCITSVDLTFTTIQNLTAMIQAAVAACPGTFALRAFVGGSNGTQATPMGEDSAQNLDQAGAVVPVTVPLGTTLREAINIITRSSWKVGGAGTVTGYWATVDMWNGLRYWRQIDSVAIPSDARSFTLNSGGAVRPNALSYDVDASSIVRGVIVKGTGVTQAVFDGSGRPGKVVVLTDTTITTAAAALTAGTSYLAQWAPSIRGTVDLEVDDAAPDGYFGIAKLTITETGSGLSGSAYIVQSAAFRDIFGPLGANVTFAFGGQVPSGAAYIRQLTRTTLN